MRRPRAKRADLAGWLGEQLPLSGYGSCRVAICTNLADSPLGLCPWHSSRYQRDKRPGRARLPSSWWHRYEQFGLPVLIEYADEAAFRRWCAATPASWWPGQINLRGLRPLVCAEIKWGLFIHTQRAAADPMGPGLDPLAGGHLSRPRRRDADRLPAGCRRIRTVHRRDRQGDPARAATGLLHPSRDQGRRFHRDRPLRCALRSTRQPRRSDRHRAALAARSGVGLSGRPAAVPALPPLRRCRRRNPQGGNRTGRFPGDRRARRRARPYRAGR